MRKLTHQELLKRQKKQTRGCRLPFCVVLNNIRSLYNVGSIFRTCDGAGVEKLFLCGITGHPPNNMIAKTALDAQDHVPWEYRENIFEVLRDLKNDGYRLVFLEQMAESLPYQDLLIDGKTALVIGNEITGVSKDILFYCDQAIEIEMAGAKNSLNVAVAFGIVAYHIRNQFLKAGIL